VTHTTVLGSTPRSVKSLGQTWQERECQALLTQLVSLVGTAPSSVQFHLHRIYDIEVDTSFLALNEVQPAWIPPNANRTALAVSHRLNDSEGIEYVNAIEAAFDNTRTWSHLALRQLGPEYRNG
jgi:hypothetical protein